MSNFLANISVSLSNIISIYGYLGVAALMFLEAANIPIPSEVVMPFAGFLANRGNFGHFGLWLVILFGSTGSVLGGLTSYSIAKKIRFRKSFLEKHSFKIANSWFKKYGENSVLFCQVVPIVRTFISFPAGVFRMKLSKFLWMTVLGSFVWSSILAYAGWVLGSQWSVLQQSFSKLDLVVIFALILGAAFFVWYYYQSLKDENNHSQLEK